MTSAPIPDLFRSRVRQCEAILDSLSQRSWAEDSSLQDAAALAARIHLDHCDVAGPKGQRLFIVTGRLSALLRAAEAARMDARGATDRAQHDQCLSNCGWLVSIARNTVQELTELTSVETPG